MRVVLQKVTSATVTLSNGEDRSIGLGLVLLLAVTHDDTTADIDWLVRKILNMRIFGDDQSFSEQCVQDIRGEILVVSQFTLYGDIRKGNRPSWTRSAPPEIAKPLYQKFTEQIRESGLTVMTGEFGDRMNVSLVNEGPVTLLLDSRYRSRKSEPF